MDYLAIKQKKIAKTKKPVNIIFDSYLEKGFIIDKTRTSHTNREEVMKRLHLLNPIIKSTILPKSYIPPLIVNKEDKEEEDKEEEDEKEKEKEKEKKKSKTEYVDDNSLTSLKDESQEEMKERLEKESKNEIQSEIRLFDNKSEKEEKEEKEEKKDKKDKKDKRIVEQILYENIDPSIKIGDKLLIDRMPKQKPIKLKISPHYMTNRAKYIQKMSKLFQPYADKITSSTEDISCDNRSSTEVEDLLIHQEIVRDYLNLYTPYRGLLLYHGLGSGKTCSSIAIAEGMKTQKQIVIMTPASLKMNFFSELKKCGDNLYKKNQYWEFISIIGQPKNVAILSNALNISPKYIRKKKGAWLVDITKETNFVQLSPEDQINIDEQLNMMIRAKYIDINYNGLNMKKIKELTKDKSINPFDNRVVIIDEAHNFVSRMVN
jgi:hypothetical protein